MGADTVGRLDELGRHDVSHRILLKRHKLHTYNKLHGNIGHGILHHRTSAVLGRWRQQRHRAAASWLKSCGGPTVGNRRVRLSLTEALRIDVCLVSNPDQAIQTGVLPSPFVLAKCIAEDYGLCGTRPPLLCVGQDQSPSADRVAYKGPRIPGIV